MRKPFVILVISLFINLHLFAEENYPIGARATALSNAFTSIPDTWSTFHNQATLASFESFTAGVFYESRFLVDELSLSAASAVLPFGAGVFGLSFFQFGEGSFKEHKIGLAYSRKLSDRINAALQFDYFSQRFPENEKAAGFPTFEIGITYRTTDQLTFGAHVFNPVRNGFDTLNGKQKMAAVYRIGGHYHFSDLVLLSAEVQKNSDQAAMVKTGLEFSPLENLALRFGVSGRPVQYSAGIGYKFRKISTDIAFSYLGSLGFTPSVSIQYNL